MLGKIGKSCGERKRLVSKIDFYGRILMECNQLKQRKMKQQNNAILT